MKTRIWHLSLLALALPCALPAQEPEVPLLRPEERQAVDAQADEFNHALEPILGASAKSTVRVWAGSRRLAYGTVVADGGKVLTKLSEVARAKTLRVESGDGAVCPAVLSGAYPDEDIAVLTVQGEPLTPVVWTAGELPLGAFLTAPQPSGRPAAFGVVSVLERSLRETDKAYLGVRSDFKFAGPGVKVEEVLPDSAAAAAGLRAGDVILELKGRTLSGPMEMRTAISGLEPGVKIPIVAQRGEQRLNVEVILANRPQMPKMEGARLQQMEQMGGRTSRVRDAFSDVVQTDMRPAPDQIGGPVVDLQGRVVGMTMARADRTRSFVMPAAAVKKLLEKPAVDPAIALKSVPRQQPGIRRMPGHPGRSAPSGIVPADEDELRRHIDDMRQLMERMNQEMERLQERQR